MEINSPNETYYVECPVSMCKFAIFDYLRSRIEQINEICGTHASIATTEDGKITLIHCHPENLNFSYDGNEIIVSQNKNELKTKRKRNRKMLLCWR